MKKIKYIFILFLGIILIIYGGKEIFANTNLNTNYNQTTNTTTNNSSNGYINPTYQEFFDYDFDTHNQEMPYILSQKDPYKEVQYSNTKYSEEQIEELIKSCTVDIKFIASKHTIIGTGNIYNIDENYCYIITAKHVSVDGINNQDCKYINISLQKDINEQIIIDIKDDINVKIINSQTLDVSVLAIPLNLISQSFIQNAKTINIDNFYNTDNINETIYVCSYISGQTEHLISQCSIKNYNRGLLLFIDANQVLTPGTSGSGVFDQYGNYLGLVSTTTYAEKRDLPIEINNLINSIK